MLASAWEGYATADDLVERMSTAERSRWATAPEEYRERGRTLLLDASHLIRARASGAASAPAEVLRLVTVRVALRALRERPAASAGATSMSQTAGPFTIQTAWKDPSGEVFLTKQDLADVNGLSGRRFGDADVLARLHAERSR